MLILSMSKPSTSSSSNTRELLNNRIVGGDIVSSHLKYPYFVSLTDSNINGFYCGGSLISPNMVLTAAHCVEGGASKVVIGHTKFPLAGSYELIDVVEVYIHPDYNSLMQSSDFAILKLAVQSEFEAVVLDDGTYHHKFDEKSRFKAIGFGNIQDGGPGSNELREVEVSYQPQMLCQMAYDPTPVDNTMICAASPGRDSCNGDSGGPLIAPGPNGTRIQVGITSWGFGCADPNFPGVYSRIASQHEWITSYINKDGEADDASSSKNPTSAPSTTPSKNPTNIPTVTQQNGSPTVSPAVGVPRNLIYSSILSVFLTSSFFLVL